MIAQIHPANLGIVAQILWLSLAENLATFQDVRSVGKPSKVSRTLWSVISTPIRTWPVPDDSCKSFTVSGQCPKRVRLQYKGRLRVSGRRISTFAVRTDSMYALLVADRLEPICTSSSSNRSRCCSGLRGSVSSTAKKILLDVSGERRGS